MVSATSVTALAGRPVLTSAYAGAGGVADDEVPRIAAGAGRRERYTSILCDSRTASRFLMPKSISFNPAAKSTSVTSSRARSHPTRKGELTAQKRSSATTSATSIDGSMPRVPGRLVGVWRSAKWTGGGAINPEGKVILQPSRPVEGQATISLGLRSHQDLGSGEQPPRLPWACAFDYNSFPRHDQFPGLDTGLPEIFEVRSDSRGRIRFSDVPVFGEIVLVTAADGLAEAQWRNQNKSFDRPIELTIAEESLVSGRVLAPEEQPAGGLKVTARLSGKGELQPLSSRRSGPSAINMGHLPSTACRKSSSCCPSRTRKIVGSFARWSISSFNCARIRT